MPAKGTTCLYRPVPQGFEDLFIRVGWTSIEAETNAHAKTIRKWIIRCNAIRIMQGLPSLKEARAEFVRKHGPARSPVRMNYVMGRTNRRNRMMAVTLDEAAE